MSKRTLKAKIRCLVVSFSQVKSFGAIFRLLYRVSTCVCVFTLRFDRRVLAVYLREKGGSLNYQPGLSDLDLTVVISSTTDDLSKLSLWLDQFWARYRILKSCVPVLGEIEVYSEADFRDLLKLGPAATSSIKIYSRLFERGLPKDLSELVCEINKRQASQSVARAIQRDSVIRYLRYLLPALRSRGEPPRSLSEALYIHSAKQLYFRLQRAGAHEDLLSGEERDFSTLNPLLFCRGIGKLPPIAEEAATGTMVTETYIAETCGPEITIETSFISQFCRSFFEALPVSLQKYISVVVWNAFGVRNKAIVVIAFSDELLDSNASKDALRQLEQAYCQALKSNSEALTPYLADFPIAQPVIISKAALKIWLNLMPFEQLEFELRGKTIVGTKPELVPLSTTVIREYVQSEYVSLLSLRNNRRSSMAVNVSCLYRELLDQIVIYQNFFSGNPISLAYPRQEPGGKESSEHLFEQLNHGLEKLRGHLK